MQARRGAARAQRREIDDTLALLVRLREVSDARFVLAGTHATATARDLLVNHGIVDFVVLGEYERTALQLMKGLRDGLPVVSLPGVACRDERGGPVINARAEAIHPLDELPYPARHLFPAYFDTDMGAYRDGFCSAQPLIPHAHEPRVSVPVQFLRPHPGAVRQQQAALFSRRVASSTRWSM